MSEIESKFLFTVCQVGAEQVLKDEIARNHPALRFSYSRPGFVTFKISTEDKIPLNFQLNSIFARTYGLSLGKAKTPEDFIKFAQGLQPKTKDDSTAKQAMRLHIFERDAYSHSEMPKDFEPGLKAKKLLTQLRQELKACPDLFHSDVISHVGDLVVDIVIVDEKEWWLGAHEHMSQHAPNLGYPGGAPNIKLPEESPSRAYLKLEEALLFSNAPLRRGQTAVEIGSAPGGASFALLERGLKVIGIDPGEMDPRVLKNPEFSHVKKTVASVLREELPERIDWLLLDMNVAPSVSVFQVDRLVTRMKSSLRGILLTIKLNDWEMAKEIPHIIKHIEAMGISQVRAKQLYNNRQEILIYGFTRLGLKS